MYAQNLATRRVAQQSFAATALGIAALFATHATAQGTFSNYGTACAGSNGAAPRMIAFNLPTIGGTFDRRMIDGPPNAAAFSFLGVGALNFPLAVLGAPGCSLLVDAIVVSPTMTDGNGDCGLTLPIPNDPGLVGVSLRAQWAAIDARANNLGIVFSDAGVATLEGEGPMPVATSAAMLRGPTPGQSILQARFGGGIGVSGLSIRPEGRSSTLRDDGRGVDPIAGDGVFHALVQANFDNERAAFVARAAKIRQRGVIPEFDGGRSASFIQASALPLQAGPDSFPLLSIGTGLNGCGPAAVAIEPKNSLMITFPPVVNDPTRTWNPCASTGNPNGVWTFKHLMTEMCNQPHTGVDPRDFVFSWINSFTNPQTVNSFTVAARPGAASFISNWPLDGDGKLDLDRAPFRLLAIVNRVDLRGGSFYGGGNAGEARFVFCGVDCTGSTAEQFLVIFEYKVPISGCANVKAWGQQWADLSSMVLGSPAYNAALEAITLQFTERNLAPTEPNRSALGQLRTNEIAFGAPWELREFRIFSPTLQTTTVAQTPDLSFQNTTFLRNFLNTKPAGPAIPLFEGITPLRGGSALTPLGMFWNFPPGPTLPTAKRHAFSLNTCNGCHAGETETLFTHVKPAFFPLEAPLSKFLTGDPANPADSFYHDVMDPAGSGEERLFFDLDRRKEDLDTLVTSNCFISVLHQSIAEHALMVH